jgi:hypothetical protein
MAKATPRSAATKSAGAPITCDAELRQPAAEGGVRPRWAFLVLPAAASKRLPSRGMVSVEGTLDGVAFAASLHPDGKGSHWLKVEPSLRTAAKKTIGDTVALVFAPAATEPEPAVPAALRDALRAAPPRALETWNDITAAARRDFVQWIESAKREETRVSRLRTACDMLAKGKRRPCCFDRSGIYGKNLSCPTEEPGTRGA